MPDFLSCENAHLTIEQVMSALVTKTSGGDWALRTMLVEACSENAIDCSNNAIDLNTQLKKCIGLSSDCNLPALRLGMNKAALAKALGVAAYEDTPTAAGGGVPVGGIYFNTTSNTLVTRMS